MSFSDGRRKAGQAIFMSSVQGLADILGVVAAFFGTPWLYGKTIDFYTGLHNPYLRIWVARCY